MFPVLLATNLAGIVVMTLNCPLYSTIKSTYLLTSIPAFGVFMAMGIHHVEHKKRVATFLVFCLAMLILLTTLHIMHIVCTFDSIVQKY